MDLKTTYDLNVFSDDGIVVDSTSVDLTHNQVSDIIDHAAQLILELRDDKPIGDVAAELEEALVLGGVIEARG